MELTSLAAQAEETGLAETLSRIAVEGASVHADERCTAPVLGDEQRLLTRVRRAAADLAVPVADSARAVPKPARPTRALQLGKNQRDAGGQKPQPNE